MPPFRLEFLKHNDPNENRSFTTLHFQKLYGPGVKVSEWERYLESQPIDNDPLDPKKYDLHISHYNRLGNEKDYFQSETKEAYKTGFYPGFKAFPESPNKDLYNYYTFKDDFSRKDDKTETLCDLNSKAGEFISTMQHSYRGPPPLELKRLCQPLTPYFENRRLGGDIPRTKFLDDDFKCHTSQLQKHKGHYFTSYIPWAGHYTPGHIERKELKASSKKHFF